MPPGRRRSPWPMSISLWRRHKIWQRPPPRSSRFLPLVRPMSTCSSSRPTRRRLPHWLRSFRAIVDKKATIGTPDSFLKLLGSLFALSDKFTMAASLIAIIVAVLIAFKTMAGNIAERAREIGVLKAVGWTNRNVVTQLLSESVVQCFLAGILGLLIALVASVALGFIQVNIPIPWEMSPTPHFLPGGGDQIFKTLRLPVTCPVDLGRVCRPAFRSDRRPDRRAPGEKYFKNQTFGGFTT